MRLKKSIVLLKRYFSDDEIKVHPGLYYLQAKHGYERSQENQVKRSVNTISLLILSILGVRGLANYQNCL